MRGCIRELFVPSIVKRKREFVQKYLKEKSLDLFDQFISMAEREIDIIMRNAIHLSFFDV